jgi:hypothetical protein
VFNPNGESNSQLVPELTDLQHNRVIPISVRVLAAYAPMRRFM